MALLFRFNLDRLWRKTNPFTGQDNWGHAFFVPLIGLYYLYVHREELISPRPILAPRGSVGLWWGALQLSGIAVGLFVWAACPRTLDWLEIAVDSMGLLTQYHGWRISAIYLFLPYTVSLTVAVLLIPRRPGLAQKLAEWSGRAWPALGAWLMLAIVAWGLAFFVSVIAQAMFSFVRVALALGSLASLVGALWFTSRTHEQRPTALANALLDESAAWLGGFILGWGVLFSLWGIFPGQNDFFKDVGMVIALFGVVLLLAGWGVMRVAWFPILFLFCGLPWPDQVYSWVAGPLQHLAAAVAVRFLTICNIPSNVAGTKIMMFVVPNQKPRILNVEEACAGLKSLMTFVTLAGGWAFVFMSSRPLWHRLIQTASAVPIAIFCNVLRVSFTGLTDKWWGHEFSEGFAHRFVGLLLLVPAFFLILLVGWVLDNLFIEEADEENAASKDKAPPRGTAVSRVGGKVLVPKRAGVKPSPAIAALNGGRLLKGPLPSSATGQGTALPRSPGIAPVRKPPAPGIRPPAAARPPITAQRPRPGTGQTGAAAPNLAAANRAPQPAKPAAPRPAAEAPAANPEHAKEGL